MGSLRISTLIFAAFLTLASMAPAQEAGDVTLGLITAPSKGLRDGDLNMPKKNGIFIGGVLPRSCGAVSKLNAFDIVTSIEGVAVETAEDWKKETDKIVSGNKVKLDVLPFKGGKKPSWGTQKRVTVTARSCWEDALLAIKKYQDDVAGMTWVFHIDSPRSATAGNDLSLYFQERDGKASNLRMRLVYTDQEWLFVKSMLLSDQDTVREKFDLRFAEWNREIGSERIWEWCDVSVTKKTKDSLVASILRPHVTLRYEGDSKKHDRELMPLERARMISVLTAFKAMGGKIE